MTKKIEYNEYHSPTITAVGGHWGCDRGIGEMRKIVDGLVEQSVIKEIAPRYSHIHGTEKPVKLMERLLRLTTNPTKGGIVLDAFAGSMSVGIAAINLGLSGIMIEKNPKYYAVARQRLINHQMQQRLSL